MAAGGLTGGRFGFMRLSPSLALSLFDVELNEWVSGVEDLGRFAVMIGKRQ